MRRAGALLLEGADAAEHVARMLRNLFVLAGVDEDSKRSPYWEMIEAELRGDDDDEEEDDDGGLLSVAALDPSSRFYAWDLAERAVAAEPNARSAWVDDSLDAFEAIIDAPRDPGNDAGPMCAMAAVMNRAQLRRAWGIAARMRASGWLPNQTAAYLVRRAAALEERALARTWLVSISDFEVRALALGFAAAWSEPLLAAEDSAMVEGRGLTEFVRGLVWALDAPSEAQVATCLRLVDGHPNADGRDGALTLLEPWYAVGPVQPWLDAIATAGESCRVLTSWGLANAREQESLVELAVGYTVAQRRPNPMRWLGQESELLASLSVPAARRAFTRLMCVPGVGQRWPLRELAGSGLRRLVVHIGGETAPGAVLRALAELE